MMKKKRRSPNGTPPFFFATRKLAHGRHALANVQALPQSKRSNYSCGTAIKRRTTKETDMAESVYKVIELVGTSTESWEKAATVAIKRAAKTLRDLRVAEISQLDMVLKDGKVESYRAKVKVSFKYEG
jgi:flavin-binding protein dodecin